jgi:hypothetical protein
MVEVGSKGDDPDVSQEYSIEYLHWRQTKEDKLFISGRLVETCLSHPLFKHHLQPFFPDGANVMSKWLDELHKHDKVCTLVDDPEYKCPYRRSVSVAMDRPHKIEDIEDEDFGKEVISLNAYGCNEEPTVWWMMRPATNLDHAFMLECWKDAWSYSTVTSRMLPPNSMQACYYTGMLEGKMSQHRDNISKHGLERMSGGDHPSVPKKTYSGFRNSQVNGTNVYVWTCGNAPMSFSFTYPNPKMGPNQQTNKYIEIPCFSFKCSDGYLSVMDPLDDILARHGVKFDGLTLVGSTAKGEVGEDLRWQMAWVMRRVSTVHQYFVNTSTIKMDTAMKEALKKSKANNDMSVGEGRYAFD